MTGQTATTFKWGLGFGGSETTIQGITAVIFVGKQRYRVPDKVVGRGDGTSELCTYDTKSEATLAAKRHLRRLIDQGVVTP